MLLANWSESYLQIPEVLILYEEVCVHSVEAIYGDGIPGFKVSV